MALITLTRSGEKSYEQAEGKIMSYAVSNL